MTNQFAERICMDMEDIDAPETKTEIDYTTLPSHEEIQAEFDKVRADPNSTQLQRYLTHLVALPHRTRPIAAGALLPSQAAGPRSP